MLGLEKVVDIILNLLIALGLLAIYESQKKEAKPNPNIIELFLISVPILFFAWIGYKSLAYLSASVFTIFFVWLFLNRYIEAINNGRKDNENKTILGTLLYRIKTILTSETFFASLLIVILTISFSILFLSR